MLLLYISLKCYYYRDTKKKVKKSSKEKKEKEKGTKKSKELTPCENTVIHKFESICFTVFFWWCLFWNLIVSFWFSILDSFLISRLAMKFILFNDFPLALCNSLFLLQDFDQLASMIRNVANAEKVAKGELPAPAEVEEKPSRYDHHHPSYHHHHHHHHHQNNSHPSPPPSFILFIRMRAVMLISIYLYG